MGATPFDVVGAVPHPGVASRAWWLRRRPYPPYSGKMEPQHQRWARSGPYRITRVRGPAVHQLCQHDLSRVHASPPVRSNPGVSLAIYRYRGGFGEDKGTAGNPCKTAGRAADHRMHAVGQVDRRSHRHRRYAAYASLYHLGPPVLFNILEAPASTATSRIPRLLGASPQWGQRHSTSAALYLIQVLQVGHGGSDVVHTRRNLWIRSTSDGGAVPVRIVSPGFGGQRSVNSSNMISLVFMRHIDTAAAWAPYISQMLNLRFQIAETRGGWVPDWPG